jgi:putative tryptophan/tyrosine transport system substrate-binding protein
MRRRDFLGLVGGAAAWPLASRAQQGKLPTIGFLGESNPASMNLRTAAFVQRLRELGRFEGRNVAIEYRWGEGSRDRFTEIAAEFVRLKVDVIVTSGTPAILAAKQATAVIPIVFGSMGNPVGEGVVASLARPGGNITGLSLQTGADLSSKWLELFRAAVPGLRRLAILADRNFPTDVVEQYRGSARALGLEVASYDIRRAEDIAGAFDALKGRTDGLHVPLSPLVNTNQRRINTLAISAQLPTFYAARDYVETGGLMSYGPNYSVLWRRAADFVDKILQGTKPADIPVEQPVKFDLVVNLTTAKAIGLTIPETFLARADEVIE